MAHKITLAEITKTKFNSILTSDPDTGKRLEALMYFEDETQDYVIVYKIYIRDIFIVMYYDISNAITFYNTIGDDK